jgi:CubicO group peptidase (beta-lactamase class C family)
MRVPIHTLCSSRSRLLIILAGASALTAVAVMQPPLAAQTMQSAAPVSASRMADDPDVMGAERLFSAWIEGQIAYRGLPGIAVGVVSDQDLVWTKGFGYADVNAKVPMTAITKFRMASHSKLFAATAIMQLREEGKLRLDDPVVTYLPWFKAKRAGDDDGTITIEQLLSHSSGMQREAGDHWTSYEFPTSDELRQLYPERQAPFAPSVRWKYSNLAYAIVGMLTEQVTGKRWADYVDLNIFKPLGMNASSVDKNVPGLAGRYARGPAVRRRARDGVGDGRDVERRGHGKVRLGPVPARPARRQSHSEYGIAARDAPCPVGGRELDVRDGTRVRHQSHRRANLRGARRRLPGKHDPDAHSARRQDRRHRADEHERLESVRHRA